MPANWRDRFLRRSADLPLGDRASLSHVELQRVREGADTTVARHADWADPEADSLHRYIADLLLARMKPLQDLPNTRSTLFDESLLEAYNDWISRATIDPGLADQISQAILAGPKEIESVIEAASCSFSHPVFDCAEQGADREDLARLIWDENLADLNFMNILLPLCYSPSGEPGSEIVANLIDEFGDGVPAKHHTLLRRRMMEKIGLPPLSESWELHSYPLPAVVHFNLYVLNGLHAWQRLRLIGMLFATELLVPKQLIRVSRGWDRAGVDLSRDDYFLTHIQGDVEHGDGWSKRVIVPLVARDPRKASELAMGMSQHITVLTSLYDFQQARFATKQSG